MQAPYYPWNLRHLMQGKPTVGGLVDLGEENYRYLFRLAPDLQLLQGSRVSSSLGHGVDLHMEILEQTVYTTLCHITYYFPHKSGYFADPDATLRLYHDAGLVEVIDLRQSALPLKQGEDWPTLEQKWRVHLFLSKWLAYCVQQGHCFSNKISNPAQAVPLIN